MRAASRPGPGFRRHAAPHVLDAVDGGARIFQDQPGRPGGPGLDVGVALRIAAGILRDHLAAYHPQEHPGLPVGVTRPVRQHMAPAPARQQ